MIFKFFLKFVNILESGQVFILSRKGGCHLVHNNFVYRSNLRRQGRDLNKIYWECIYNRSTKCRGRLKSIGDELIVTNGILLIGLFSPKCITRMSINRKRISLLFFAIYEVEHNHPEDTSRVESAQQAGCLIYRTISSINGKMDKMAFDCTLID